MHVLSRLGDAVIEEAVFRLVARQALAALEGAEAGHGLRGFGSDGIREGLNPLSGRLLSALRVAVSNENLEAVSLMHGILFLAFPSMLLVH